MLNINFRIWAVIFIFHVYCIADFSKPIDSLYKFREYYSNLTYPCGYYIGTKYFKCGSNRFNIIRSFSGRSIQDWKKNEQQLSEAIVGLNLNWRVLEKIKSRIIKDSILAYSNCIILQYDTCFGSIPARKAYSNLLENVPYKYLNKYIYLIKNIQAMHSFTEKEKSRLLALCSPDAAATAELLKNNNLPLQYQARLGIKEAEIALIENFNKDTNYATASENAEKLGICGSKKCIETLIKSFNKPIYSYDKKGCISRTIRVDIIKALQRHHPEEILLTDKWMYMSGQNFHKQDELSDTTITKPYIDSLISWMVKTYLINPVGPIKKYVFLHDWCGPSLKEDIKSPEPIIEEEIK
ncbi:hypothetical protein JW960_01155 [candidate division KSB1 bacterium]|nr:hypothetical protein [candidate division KSB1 bacterium]